MTMVYVSLWIKNKSAYIFDFQKLDELFFDKYGCIHPIDRNIKHKSDKKHCKIVDGKVVTEGPSVSLDDFEKSREGK